MDPVSLILAALVAGASQAAGNAIPDAYKGFKALIKRKFSGEKKAEIILDEYEADPDTYEAPLKKKLVETGVDKDKEIVEAAKTLLKQLEDAGIVSQKYQVQFEGEVKGGQVGDHNTQTNNFN
ncbi:hypothetical protein AY600_00650 [Phormidium willei BDU 130791]|jgi:hypothetical protein|nr:hypothetical protein AY600_00650 [Phormidium willei BDU 130791]